MHTNIDVWKIICPHCNQESHREADFRLNEENVGSLNTLKSFTETKVCYHCNYEFTVAIKIEVEVLQ